MRCLQIQMLYGVVLILKMLLIKYQSIELPSFVYWLCLEMLATQQRVTMCYKYCNFCFRQIFLIKSITYALSFYYVCSCKFNSSQIKVVSFALLRLRMVRLSLMHRLYRLDLIGTEYRRLCRFFVMQDLKDSWNNALTVLKYFVQFSGIQIGLI